MVAARRTTLFTGVHGWRGVVSAILAIFLWPLVLLKVNLYIRSVMLWRS